MKKDGGKKTLIESFGQSVTATSVRTGLVNMIPVLIIGAFALILNTFPVPAYQSFLKNTAVGSALSSLFSFVNSATFGVLSVYMTISISRAFVSIKANPNTVPYGAEFASLLSFFIMAGVNLKTFDTGSTGPKSMFLAIITGLGASQLYLLFEKLFSRRKRLRRTLVRKDLARGCS